MYHRETGVNIVTDGMHSCAKCSIEKLGLIVLLMARMHVPSVLEGGWD